MGNFGCDAHLLYGYRPGILYRESYKGSVSLGLAEWDGDALTNTLLYEGTYDRDGDPPSIRELSDYYDSDRLLKEIPEFESLDKEASTGSASSSRDLSNYCYRTVKTTDSRGALVFQSSPNGSFMNDYQFYNGDRIYVNLTWRQDGCAIAYQNGVYGYVDASYISW